MFVDAVEQEKQWAQYLFKDGSMIGLNAQLLDDYIEWICCKRMTVRLKCPYKTSQAKPTIPGHKNGLQVQKYKLFHKKLKSVLM